MGKPMIIFGSKGKSINRGTGVFHCPHCRADRRYTKKEMKRMGHLYFVPLVPLGSLGEFIECNTCGGQFDPGVLSLPTRAELEQRIDIGVRSAVAAMIRADASVSDSEREAGTDVVSSFISGPYNPADLERDLAELDPTHLENRLSEIAAMLTESGKVQIVQACVFMAVSDRELHENELDLINRVAAALGIPPQYVPGIVQATIDEMVQG